MIEPVSLLPCPFCGKAADIDDDDTLYPNGIGWKSDGDLGRTYHNYRQVPKEQRCWSMHCPEVAGGCGAEVSGDSKDEAIAKWNKRAIPEGYAIVPVELMDEVCESMEMSGLHDDPHYKKLKAIHRESTAAKGE